jgi:ABC-2 type transport system permease protein
MQVLRRIVAVTRKELRQLRRDRLTFGMIVGIPLIQLLLFGYAINTNVRGLRAGIADAARTERSRILVAALASTQVVRPTLSVSSAEELEKLILAGKIDLGVVIPQDLARRIVRNELPAVQLLVDGADTAVAAAVGGVTGMPVPDPRIMRTVPQPQLFSIRILYNAEKRSAVSIVPGLLGVILTMTMVLFTSIAIVRERERGSLELLITTPVRSFELMIGKIVPYIGIGTIQICIILSLGWFFFEVPIRGSLVDLYLAGLAFIAANLAMGLLFSTIAQSQFQSMQLTFFFFLPNILLSGFMFPFVGMPESIQKLAELLPLTHFNRLSRGILLKGATLWDLKHELAPLGVFFLVVLGISVLRFRKRLD